MSLGNLWKRLEIILRQKTPDFFASHVISNAAKKVIGIDIDSMAVTAANNNSLKNNVSEQLIIYQGSLPDSRITVDSFDIAVANISAKVLVDVAPHLVKAIRKDGTIIASGLLSENQDVVQKAIAMAGGKNISSRKEDGWSTLIATK